MNKLYKIFMISMVAALPLQLICDFNPSSFMILMKESDRASELPSSYRHVIVTFINRGNQPITVDADMLSPDLALSKEEIIKRRNQDVAGAKKVLLGIAGISGAFGLYRLVNPTGKNSDDAMMFTAGMVSFAMFFACALAKFSEWEIAANPVSNALFEPVVIMPGQIALRIICVDAQTPLPASCECRVADTSGMRYTVMSQRFMME